MKQLLIVLLLITATGVTAQTIKQTELDREITSLLFNGNWQKADTLIDLQIQKLPNHPKYYFMKARNIFYGRFTSTNGAARDVALRTIIFNCWEAVEIAEELPQTTEIKFYLGNSYALIARANVMLREYWTAYWNGDKAEDYLEDVIEEDPECYDAYLNLGIQQYFPEAFLEGFRYFMAWLGGASGDRVEGLEFITKAAEKGNLLQAEANYALAFLYWIGEDNPKKSLAYFEEFIQAYPESKRTEYFHNQMKMTNLIIDEGVDFLVAEKDSLIESYKLESPYILGSAASQLVNLERNDEAKTVHEINYDLFPQSYYPARALGGFYVNQENEEKAIEYYKISYHKVDADTSFSVPVKIRIKDMLLEGLDELGADVDNL